MLRRTSTDSQGFTLVELLVVLVIMGIIGGIVVSGITQAMSVTQTTQNRIHAMAELQRGAERIARELRAACPIQGPVPLVDDDVSAIVLRNDERYRHRIWIEADAVQHQVERDVDGDWVVEIPQRVLVDAVSDPDVALFEYLDRDGEAATAPHQVRSVRITLVRDLDAGDSLRVETVVQLRNRGQTCG